MNKTLILLILSISLLASPLAINGNDEIHGCFNHTETKKSESFTLILRNYGLVSNDLVINHKENKNSVLVIKKFNSHSKESFEVSPIRHRKNVQNDWSPRPYEKSIFTIRDHFRSFSINEKEGLFYLGNLIEYAGGDLPLICSTNPNLIKEIFLNLTR